MTVLELIEKLQTMPKDLSVVVNGFMATSPIEKCFLFDEHYDQFDPKLGDIPVVVLELV